MTIQKRLQFWAQRQNVALAAKVHDLSYFFWESTLACNLTCRHCGSDCQRNNQAPDLPAEKVLAVLTDVATHYHQPGRPVFLAVTGGEPLMRPDLWTILAQARALGFEWGMVSNGFLLDQERLDQCLATGMRTLVISLDGFETSHNHLRQHPLSFFRAKRALELAVQSQALAVVEVVTCVHHGNIDELEDLALLLKSIGIQRWRLFTIFPKGRAGLNADLVVNGTLLKRVLSFIQSQRLTETELQVSYSEEGFLGCEWEGQVRDFQSYCSAGIRIGGLLADGSYSACPSLARQWVQGHVDELPFSQAWEERYGQMRDRRWMKQGECADCSQWKNCRSNSLHLWNFETSSTNFCHWRALQASTI